MIPARSTWTTAAVADLLTLSPIRTNADPEAESIADVWNKLSVQSRKEFNTVAATVTATKGYWTRLCREYAAFATPSGIWPRIVEPRILEELAFSVPGADLITYDTDGAIWVWGDKTTDPVYPGLHTVAEFETFWNTDLAGYLDAWVSIQKSNLDRFHHLQAAQVRVEDVSYYTDKGAVGSVRLAFRDSLQIELLLRRRKWRPMLDEHRVPPGVDGLDDFFKLNESPST